ASKLPTKRSIPSSKWRRRIRPPPAIPCRSTSAPPAPSSSARWTGGCEPTSHPPLAGELLLRILDRGAAQAALGQIAGHFQDRISHRREVGIDTLEIANDIEMDGAGLDRFRPRLAQPRVMAVGGGKLGDAHRGLFRQQPPRQGDVASGEHIEGKPHIV